jgi:hypothetical protein
MMYESPRPYRSLDLVADEWIRRIVGRAHHEKNPKTSSIPGCPSREAQAIRKRPRFVGLPGSLNHGLVTIPETRNHEGFDRVATDSGQEDPQTKDFAHSECSRINAIAPAAGCRSPAKPAPRSWGRMDGSWGEVGKAPWGKADATQPCPSPDGGLRLLYDSANEHRYQFRPMSQTSDFGSLGRAGIRGLLISDSIQAIDHSRN